MVAPNYCGASELKDRLGIAGEERDFALETICDAASRWVENATRRRFYTVSETRYYTAAGGGMRTFPWNLERPSGGYWSTSSGFFMPQHIQIDDFVSVSSVATDEDGDGVYERTWTVGTDYWLGPANAAADGKPYRFVNRNQFLGRYIFPMWENALSVTGACGAAATTPDPIRELSLIVAEMFARPLLEMSIPSVQSYQLGTDLQITMRPVDLPPSAQLILQLYVDPVFA